VQHEADKWARVANRASPLMETLGGLAICLAIIYSGYLIIYKGAAPGAFISFLAAFLLAYEPAKRLARLNLELNNHLVGVRMLFEVMDSPATEPGDDDKRLLFPPVVVSEVAHEHRLAREEIFGPIVTVIDVGSYDEGVAKVNDSRYGLSAGLATTSLSKAHDFAARARAGVVKVNRPTTGLDLNVPFGGVGSSSTNTFREQGERAVDFYTWSKSVYIGHE